MGTEQPPAPTPAPFTLPIVPPETAHFLGACIAIAIGVADAFTGMRFGELADLGFIVAGLTGVGLQSTGVLPR